MKNQIITKRVIIILLTLFCIHSKAQQNNNQNINQTKLTQIIKGNVFDIESGNPLIGVNIIVLNLEPITGTTSNIEGFYKIANIPLGRFNIKLSYIGYETKIISEVLVTSSKEVVLNVGLKQSVSELSEVTIKAYTEKNQPLNTMATVSARSFSVEETRRYAGGADDPARMASAFAGVTVGNLQDNAIIIRGNSPKGVGWRIEGIEVPNPNHFAGGNVAGGGGVTIFSSQMLSNSDFFTGAFPAEYGNAIAGVFDMKLRTGNNEKREYAFQVGVMGIDFSSEGPFKKGKTANYLFNYRYSTFGLLTKYKIIPTTEVIGYQDLSFKINIPSKKFGTFNLWAIGGLDTDHNPGVSDTTKWKSYWDRIESDILMDMCAAGLNHKYQFNSKTFLNSTIATTTYSSKYQAQTHDASMVKSKMYDLFQRESQLILNAYIIHKFNSQHTIKTGINSQIIFYNIDNSGAIQKFQPSTYTRIAKENGKSNFYEYYLQYKFDILSNISINGGINSCYFEVNNDYSIDPRIGIKWQFLPKHALSIGYGKHSQRENLKFYFIKQFSNGESELPNKNLKLSHSDHYILAYDWLINENMRLKIEPYYQYLYSIPGIANTNYSMINFKQDYTFNYPLVNTNLGRNIGIDMTLEKFLSKNYYFLITGSLFESTYKGDDGIWHNSRYNKNIVINTLFGKEFFFKKNRTLGVNTRLNLIGGERYSPIDETISKLMNDVVFDESKAFSKQFPLVTYLNFTITYRSNKKNFSGIWALQVLNALGAPQYQFIYNYKTTLIEQTPIRVTIPVLSYKIEF